MLPSKLGARPGDFTFHFFFDALAEGTGWCAEVALEAIALAVGCAVGAARFSVVGAASMGDELSVVAVGSEATAFFRKTFRKATSANTNATTTTARTTPLTARASLPELRGLRLRVVGASEDVGDTVRTAGFFGSALLAAGTEPGGSGSVVDRGASKLGRVFGSAVGA